jgi:hypothetical protein
MRSAADETALRVSLSIDIASRNAIFSGKVTVETQKMFKIAGRIILGILGYYVIAVLFVAAAMSTFWFTAWFAIVVWPIGTAILVALYASLHAIFPYLLAGFVVAMIVQTIKGVARDVVREIQGPPNCRRN